jgi:hypothetical protein
MSESSSAPPPKRGAPAETGEPGAESGCSSAERMVRMEWPGRRCGRAGGEGIWEPASETMAGGLVGGEGVGRPSGWLGSVPTSTSSIRFRRCRCVVCPCTELARVQAPALHSCEVDLCTPLLLGGRRRRTSSGLTHRQTGGCAKGFFYRAVDPAQAGWLGGRGFSKMNCWVPGCSIEHDELRSCSHEQVGNQTCSLELIDEWYCTPEQEQGQVPGRHTLSMASFQNRARDQRY